MYPSSSVCASVCVCVSDHVCVYYSIESLECGQSGQQMEFFLHGHSETAECGQQEGAAT